MPSKVMIIAIQCIFLGYRHVLGPSQSHSYPCESDLDYARKHYLIVVKLAWTVFPSNFSSLRWQVSFQRNLRHLIYPTTTPYPWKLACPFLEIMKLQGKVTSYLFPSALLRKNLGSINGSLRYLKQHSLIPPKYINLAVFLSHFSLKPFHSFL